MRTILVTGFEPFGGASINPSEVLARFVDGHEVGPGHEVGAARRTHRVVGRVLPCVFGQARKQLVRLVRTLEPTIVVCLGQAGGRIGITVERVAINVDDARIADNAGAQPVDRSIHRGGPVGYWSTLPIKAIVESLRADDIPAAVSQSAGTFVCNHVFYALMHELARDARRGARGGFVHVPDLPECAPPDGPSLPLATQQRALTRILEACVATKRDVTVGGGALH